MKDSEHKGGSNIVIDQIITIAQQHFAQFGFEKTSMRGISRDINKSKALLYYYFSDKEHLYRAIVFKENDQFLFALREKIQQEKDPIGALKKYVLIRTELFRKLINLNRSKSETMIRISTFMKATNATLRNQEKEVVIGIFKKGVDKGIFKISDLEESADLFLDLLKGLRISIMKEMAFYYLDEDEYDLLIRKTLQFVDVFTKGIRT